MTTVGTLAWQRRHIGALEGRSGMGEDALGALTIG